VAENPAVAKGYEKTLTGRGAYTVDGNAVDENTIAHQLRAYQAASEGGDDALRKFITDTEAQFSGREIPLEVLDELDAADNLIGKKVERSTGAFYELDLPDETIGKMLDWDKPLSEQPESVRKAINDHVGYDYVKEAPAAKGSDVYAVLSMREGDDKGASKALNSLGIPGIKYLDGTSRSAGEGTRNFVVFDEQYITPLKRNGESLQAALDAQLPMDEASRMQRAREMGFDTDVYHGTAEDIAEFDLKRGGNNTKARSAQQAVWLVDDPQVAEGYARYAAEDVPVQTLIDESYAAERRGG
jgi:hypothetical protein